MKSMNWNDVVAIFSEPNMTPTKKGATKRGAIHKHNPTWKPAKPDMTPKQWHKANRKRTNALKAK